MNKYGFCRIAAASPEVKVADVEYNMNQIKELSLMAMSENAAAIVFPELSITGYTCADLFMQSALLDAVEMALSDIVEWSNACKIMLVVGAPLRHNGKLYNTAVFIYSGKVLGVVPKSYLPNNNEFYEKRWFTSGKSISNSSIKVCEEDVPFGTDVIVKLNGVNFAAEICEDLWVTIPPSSQSTLAGADVIFNLSATNELIGKHQYLIELIAQQSARCRCAYIYASAGAGESSTDLVYAGNAIIAENGVLLAESERFTNKSLLSVSDIDIDKLRHERLNSSSYSDNSEQYVNQYRIIYVDDENIDCLSDLKRYVDPHPFVPSGSDRLDKHCKEIFSIQSSGLAQRLRATGCKNIVVGLSGGLDSTLAILVAVKAFDSLGLSRKGIHAITMPGFGTTDRTYHNALTLIDRLGVSGKEISIAKAVKQHFADIGHNIEVHDVTYENSQARERTQILMDYANKVGGMVLGTGDLSELALGWCTYNGDQMSMYGVNASVPKTLVKHLVSWVAKADNDAKLRECLLDIVATPISPELIPAASDGTIKQKTEDLVGPYELHDFFLYNMMRNGFSPQKIYFLARNAFHGEFDDSTIKRWMKEFYRRFFGQQFKRSCMPDGPKVGSICLSPRGDWRMPSDASSRLWLTEVEKLD